MKTLIIALGFVLATGTALSKPAPQFNHSKMVDDETMDNLVQGQRELPKGAVKIPSEPYRLNQSQKRDAEQCVTKELAGDPQAERTMDVRAYCRCFSTFDPSRFMDKEWVTAAAVLEYSQQCDDRHKKTPTSKAPGGS